jgi:hypothetical protein
MIGTKIPPALADVDGMAGARIASATFSPIDNPKVLCPNFSINRFASLPPRPVFSIPLKIVLCHEIRRREKTI